MIKAEEIAFKGNIIKKIGIGIDLQYKKMEASTAKVFWWIVTTVSSSLGRVIITMLQSLEDRVPKSEEELVRSLLVTAAMSRASEGAAAAT